MSTDALHREQFGEQLAMFMATDEVVDNVRKGDSFIHSGNPREQWEKPVHIANGRKATTISLRDHKLSQVDDPHDYRYKDAKPSTMGPLEISHDDAGKTLQDGHHRLAFAESRKMPWVPVRHREGW